MYLTKMNIKHENIKKNLAKMFNIRSEADSAAMRGQAGMQLGLGNNSRQLLVEGESGKYVDFCSLITFIQRRER